MSSHNTKAKTWKIMVILCVSLVFTSFPVLNATNVYTLTVRTDHSQYYPGETVRISGSLKEDGTGVSGASVCVSIKDPNGVEVFSICLQTTSQGTFTVTYTAGDTLGHYQIKAEAHDYNLVAYDSFEVVSRSVTANATGPYYGVVDQPIQFQGNVKGGKSPYTWLWVFGDGANASTERNPVYAYHHVGNYTVTLTVKDQGGYEDTDETTVTITNELIADAHGPYNAPPNETIQFTGSAYGGYPPYISYFWDFGDGTNTTEQNPTHVYNALGEYNVTLTVTDSKDIQASDTTTVFITENMPPDKPEMPTGPSTGKPGTEYTYSTSTADPNGHPVYYLWDWGDGNTSGWLGPYDSATHINMSYTWESKGDYEIRVKAKDIYGLESDWSDPLPVSMPKDKQPFLHGIMVLQKLIGWKLDLFLPWFPFLNFIF